LSTFKLLYIFIFIQIQSNCASAKQSSDLYVLQGRFQNFSPGGSNFCPQNYKNTIPFHIQADVSCLYLFNKFTSSNQVSTNRDIFFLKVFIVLIVLFFTGGEPLKHFYCFIVVSVLVECICVRPTRSPLLDKVIKWIC